MSQRIPITVRLESFEGPLDLLLYLIQSHELDISRISISKITDQYLAYVRFMQELNFDTASEFLVMAATLLHWKSKSVLPQEKDPEKTDAADEIRVSQEDLIHQLREHQRFLSAGQDLAELPLLHEDVFVRPNRKPPIVKISKQMDLTALTLAYQEMLARSRKRTAVLRKETVSISGKIVEFKARLKVGEMVGLWSLLSGEKSRAETVVTFLASLELSRLRKMRLHQERTYAEIYLELIEALHHLNDEELTSFESANPPFDGPEAANAQAKNEVPFYPNDFQDLLIPQRSGDAALSIGHLREGLGAPQNDPGS